MLTEDVAREAGENALSDILSRHEGGSMTELADSLTASRADVVDTLFSVSEEELRQAGFSVDQLSFEATAEGDGVRAVYAGSESEQLQEIMNSLRADREPVNPDVPQAGGSGDMNPSGLAGDAEASVGAEAPSVEQQLSEPGTGLREEPEGGTHRQSVDEPTDTLNTGQGLGDVNVTIAEKPSGTMRGLLKMLLKGAFGVGIVLLGAQAVASSRSGWFLVKAPGYDKPKQLTHRQFWAQDTRTIRFAPPTGKGTTNLGAGTFAGGDEATPVTRYCDPKILCADADDAKACAAALDPQATEPVLRSAAVPTGVVTGQDLRSLRCGLAKPRPCQVDADCGRQGGRCDPDTKTCTVLETLVVIRIDNMSLFDVCGAALSKAGYWVGEAGDASVQLVRAGIKTANIANNFLQWMLDHWQILAGVGGGILLVVLVVYVVRWRTSANAAAALEK